MKFDEFYPFQLTWHGGWMFFICTRRSSPWNLKHRKRWGPNQINHKKLASLKAIKIPQQNILASTLVVYIGSNIVQNLKSSRISLMHVCQKYYSFCFIFLSSSRTLARAALLQTRAQLFVVAARHKIRQIIIWVSHGRCFRAVYHRSSRADRLPAAHMRSAHSTPRVSSSGGNRECCRGRRRRVPLTRILSLWSSKACGSGRLFVYSHGLAALR